MKLLKRIYCRVFQTAFRLALPVLPYKTPKVLQRVDQVPGLLKSRGIDRVLLVTDASITSLGLTQPLLKALEENGIFCAVYDGTVANPTAENVAIVI